MDQPQTGTTQSAPEYDFESAYANQSLVEMSEWDLKVIFGQVEQHTGKAAVNWHTAVTMPWLHAKLLSYYLRVSLAAYELTHGKIKVPANVLPPKPEPPNKKQLASDPNAKAVYQAVKNLHAEAFEST